MEMEKKSSPEERLLKVLREGMTLEEKLAAAKELEEEGEKLEVILQIYPEYAEVPKKREAI